VSGEFVCFESKALAFLNPWVSCSNVVESCGFKFECNARSESLGPMRCMWLLQEEGAESVLVGDGSVDYQGRPANRRKTGGWRSTPYIFCKLYSTLQTPSFQ
jgi:hypothetical protein